jgi:hypothetical protein
MSSKNSHQLAVQIAVLLCFVMGGIGWACGLEPATCASRAALGAAAAYGLIRLAGKLVVKVLVGALVEDQIRRKQLKEQKG